MIPATPPGDADLGRYRLVRPLGRGGMGEVYLARDQALPRDVAIKFITSAHAADPDARRRLIREAEAAAGLDHPGICTVYDTGETADGRAYIVMQYVDGQPLTERLLHGPLPVRDALALCADVAEALDAAHAHGIVHRDLKPANVMITASGRPKLVDFGIAKVMLTAPAAADAETASSVTTRGSIVGTVGYMSPEQVQQRGLDGRSDLFSLGALLFECLTGRRAFSGVTPLETLGQVLHVHPPAVSALRPGLDERHDALCRRLLAKDPADRFDSAQQAIGAIRLLIPDTSRTEVATARAATVKRFSGQGRRPWLVFGMAALLAIVLGMGWAATRWSRYEVPADAEAAYERGTEALRQGTYFTASNALEEAVRRFPEYALAYARLAEARSELDEQQLAQESLLKIDPSWHVPRDERLRLEAIRALVLRSVDDAIAGYRELARRRPGAAGAWLDLGRAQESAGLRTDARASYQRAVEADRQYAPAYVRLGYVEALSSRREEAVTAFARAERLYQARVDVEGLTEVLLRRGAMHDSFNQLEAARQDLERALTLATEVNSTSQQVRARLSLSSVLASEGRVTDAVAQASAAIQDALTQRLETVAAEGLIDLAFIMQSAPGGATAGGRAARLREAEAHARRAVQLAEGRNARRTAARAKLQLAAIHAEQERPRDTLTLVATVLPFVSENRYRRFELLGLSIAARAHLALDDLEQARQISTEVLRIATMVEDETQIGLARTNLASAITALGDYPEALRLRRAAEEIHVHQGDEWSIPYDLANRADLLIRLGQPAEAAEALHKLEAGIAEGKDSYLTRRRHAPFYRAFAAATDLRCEEALSILRQMPDGGAADIPAVLHPAIAAYCHAREGRRVEVKPPGKISPTLLRERHYWIGAAALHLRDWSAASAAADTGLRLLGNKPNDELRWRLSAVALLAARGLDKRDIVASLAETMQSSLTRLEARWGPDFAAYVERRDLMELRGRAAQR